MHVGDILLILYVVIFIWSIWSFRKFSKVQDDYNRISEKITELKKYAEITQREHRKQLLSVMLKVRSVSSDSLLPKVIKDEERFFNQIESGCDDLTKKIALICINHPAIKRLCQDK